MIKIARRAYYNFFYSLGNNLSGIFIFISLFFLVLGGVLYMALGKSATTAVIKQFQQRELSVSKAGAASVTGFLKLVQNSLVRISGELSSQNELDTELLDNAIKSWGDTPLIEIIILDSEGTVQYVASKAPNGMREGFSYANSDFYAEAIGLQNGQVFIGDPIRPPLGAYNGQYVLPISVRHQTGDEEPGVMVGIVLLSDLTDSYLKPLEFVEGTRVYLIDHDGTVIHSPFERIIGANYYDSLKEANFLGADITIDILKRAAQSNQSGTLDIALPNEGTGLPLRFLIAHSPVFYNDHHWTLSVAIPADAALSFVAPYYTNQLGIMTVSFLVMLAIFVIIAKNKAYKDGYVDYGRELWKLRDGSEKTSKKKQLKK